MNELNPPHGRANVGSTEYVSSFVAEGGWILERSVEPVEADRVRIR